MPPIISTAAAIAKIFFIVYPVFVSISVLVPLPTGILQPTTYNNTALYKILHSCKNIFAVPDDRGIWAAKKSSKKMKKKSF
jgi:hypothetical protein